MFFSLAILYLINISITLSWHLCDRRAHDKWKYKTFLSVLLAGKETQQYPTIEEISPSYWSLSKYS